MKRELELLREKMRETGVDACLIPTSDFHGSEYVGDLSVGNIFLVLLVRQELW